MNLADAKRELMAHAEAGNSVLMVSSSGIGKSQMQLQAFSEIKARDAARGIKWGLGTVFAATQTPPDLIGFQFKGERKYLAEDGTEHNMTITDPSVPLWMLSVPHGDDPGSKPAFFYDRYYLIIEEYGQGEADVKKAIAEIFLNGGTAPWYLPAGSIRVASSNHGARYGVTKDFDFCIARRTLLNVVGDVDVWINDFADKPYQYQGKVWQTMPVTKAFAKAHPEILFEEEPKEQGPWCNPRTLCAADRYLQIKAGGQQVPMDPVTQESVAGTIGTPATVALFGHLQFALELPSKDDVIKDPTGTPVPSKADLQMLMAYTLAAYAQPDEMAEIIQYVQRLPKDMAVTFVTALLRRDYKGMCNLPAVQGWISKNATLVAIIGSLSQ